MGGDSDAAAAAASMEAVGALLAPEDLVMDGICISKLSDAKVEMLKQVFCCFGTIVEADDRPGLPSGGDSKKKETTAYIRFESEEAAEQALVSHSHSRSRSRSRSGSGSC